MKRLFIMVAAVVVACLASCKYDDGELWDSFRGLENRVASLEELCKQMNTNISSMQTIISALQNNDYVTGVAPVTSGGQTIGYTISFTKSSPITIYHGEKGDKGDKGDKGETGATGATGATGKDGHTPVIGVRQNTDGVYYWTLDGDWLLDNSGSKVKAEGKDGQNGADGKVGENGADGKDGQNGSDGKDGQPGAPGRDGITPQLKIENGYWFVSTDNGSSWTNLGKATGENGKDGANGTNGKDGEDGNSMFQDVTQDESNVYFTLANGETITLPKRANYFFEIEETSDVQFFEYGETKNYAVTQSGIANCMVYCPNGWSGKLNGDVLTVKAPTQANTYADTQGQISILASTAAGQCVIVKFDVQSAGMAITVPDTSFKTYLVENFDTNHDGEISIAEAQQVTDISCNKMGITSLEGIEYFENLEVLGCYSNKLTGLDISHNLKLKTLSCGDNPMETLEIENHPSLENLWCDAAGFSTLKLSGLEKLTMIRAAGLYTSTSGSFEVTKRGEITTVQLTDCPNLGFVDLACNKVNKFNVENCNNIYTIGLTNNNLSQFLSFKDYPRLYQLLISGNNIVNLTFENCPRLNSLTLDDCPYFTSLTAPDLQTFNITDVKSAGKWGEVVWDRNWGSGSGYGTFWLMDKCGVTDLTINKDDDIWICKNNITLRSNGYPYRTVWNAGGSKSGTDLIIQNYSDHTLDLRNASINFKSIDCTQSPLIEKIYLPEGFDGNLRYNENVLLVYGDEEQDR